jgi:hypothetical protein
MLTRRGLLKRAVAGVVGLLGLGGVAKAAGGKDEESGSVWMISCKSWDEQIRFQSYRYSQAVMPPFRNYICDYAPVTDEEIRAKLIAKMRQLAKTTKFHPPLSECRFRDARVDLSKLIVS